MIREVIEEDLERLLELYLYLHEKSTLEVTDQISALWNRMIQDENHHLIVKEVDNELVSSCVCIIIPNLTRNARPYAFIENVVTHEAYRGKGYASECLNYAKNIAIKQNCYKIMLLTGAKDQETLNFYKNAGFNNTDKTAFIQWINS